jgi:hypothetical protein
LFHYFALFSSCFVFILPYSPYFKLVICHLLPYFAMFCLILQGIDDLITYFGEDPTLITPNMFFAMILRFCRDYTKCEQVVTLHCCYTVVTLLLHCCYTVVTLLLQSSYTAVTLLLQFSYTAVTLLSRSYSASV